MTALQDKYRDEVAPKIMEKFGFSNVMQIPRLSKIVVNMGLGIIDKDQARAHAEELALITGQRPVMTKAGKSISNFKLREGMTVGARVTLRGQRMYEFLDRLISTALPRIRDFRGVSVKSFDGRGNYTLGISEQSIFPELDPNNISNNQGMDITIVTSAVDDAAARELLSWLGMPFAK